MDSEFSNMELQIHVAEERIRVNMTHISLMIYKEKHDPINDGTLSALRSLYQPSSRLRKPFESRPTHYFVFTQNAAAEILASVREYRST